MFKTSVSPWFHIKIEVSLMFHPSFYLFHYGFTLSTHYKSERKIEIITSRLPFTLFYLM
jgi:hypothetical protein